MIRMNATLTPGKFIKSEILFIDKIIELPALGSGEFGEAHEMSSKMIANITQKHFMKNLDIAKETLKTTHMVIDDNRKHYVNLLKPKLDHMIEHFSIPIKNGHYDIISRQDIMENAFKFKILYNHKDNKAFEDDIKTTVKADINSPKRKTSGATNYLDRIDPTEYAMYPFLGTIQKALRMSKRRK